MAPRRLLVAVTWVFLAVGVSKPVAAQLTPADSASVLLNTAVRFAQEGRADVADALYRFISRHFATTAAAAEARARMAATAISPAGVAVQGSGRVELQVWSTLYGLWLGVAIPGAFGADGSSPYGLGLLLGGPGGFLAGKAIARSRPLTEGQARAITFGGTWGTWQGLGWINVLDIGEGYRCDFDVCTNDGNVEERFAGMIVGGLAGIGVGTLLSRRDISPGTATTVNFGALWGTWLGFAVGYLADLEDDNLMASSLLGGDVGLAGAALMQPAWRMSRSRARLVSIYGVMGGLAGVGADLLIQPDDDKVSVAIPLLGSVVGLVLGGGMTRDYDNTHEPGGEMSTPGSGLLRLRNGRLSLNMPLPVLQELRLEGAERGRRPSPALGVNLLDVRFR